MKIIKKFFIIIVAIIVIAFLFLYRSYNLKKLEEKRNAVPTSSKSDVVCVDDHKPVCGEDGKTYSSKCEAISINGINVAHDGECKTGIGEDISAGTGDKIGESNLGETTETGLTRTGESNEEESGSVVEDKPVIVPIEKPSADYLKNLRSQCGEDSCCLSSVDNMESGGYKEAIDSKCPYGYAVNNLSCEGSYVWCEADENITNAPTITSKPTSNPVPTTNTATGVVGGQKVLNYFNPSFSYGFSVPSNTYFSGFGSQGGASHAVGISTSSGASTFGDNPVKVFFYKGKILPELEGSHYGMYQDKKTGMTYIEVNGNSVIVDGGNTNQKIVDMIIKTIYVK